MDSLRELFWMHYQQPGPFATIWDQWIPEAVLWPATTQREKIRTDWAAALLHRQIDAEGYVATQQHDGTAHAQGWPFPLWHQGAGVGWHFAGTGVTGYDAPTRSKPSEWKLYGATGGEIGQLGWHVSLNAKHAMLQPPAFKLDAPL